MAVPLLDVAAQNLALEAELQDAFTRVLPSGRYILGDEVSAFENETAARCGAAHGIGTSSGTDALLLALMCLDIGPGDEVIVPDLTWIASAAPISYVGATPVFADMDENTWCLCAESVRACLTENTKAILPVDLYGGVPDYTALQAIADEHGLKIIEDAAEAIGSEFDGRKAGALGDVAAFSFHGSKTFTTGEGGMLVTDDDELHARVMQLRDHGREPGDIQFKNTEVAFKYKMPPVAAAIGLAQVERAEELVARKREIFEWYREELAGVEGITLNHEPANTKNTFWMVTAVLDPMLEWPKEKLMAAFDAEGIEKLKGQGCDFLIFDAADTSSMAVNDDDLSSFLHVSGELDRMTAAAVNVLGFTGLSLVDALEGSSLDVQQLIDLAKLQAQVEGPLLVRGARVYATSEITALRNAGVNALLVALDDAETIKEIRENMRQVQPKRSSSRSSSWSALAPHSPDEEDE